MFQSFTLETDPSKGCQRLKDLREAMVKADLDVWLLPHGDEHRNEYLPENVERLSWLTGFTGSAGFAIITVDQAIVFADGRYTLQLSQQIDERCFTPGDLINEPPAKWLEQNAKPGMRIGFDAASLTLKEHQAFNAAANKSDAELVASDNLVDLIWKDRPSAPTSRVTLHPLEYAGETTDSKLKKLKTLLAEKNADFALLSDPASLAWIFNIRGSDVAHNPLALGFALLHFDGKPDLFLTGDKLTNNVHDTLSNVAVLHELHQLRDVITQTVADKTVLLDPNRNTVLHADLIKDASGQIEHARDLVALPRAIKNETEISGTRHAHMRDGVAMVRFLHWLDSQVPGTVDEITAAKQLERFRKITGDHFQKPLMEIAFDTISGAGANGAIVHYRVSEESNTILKADSLYLVDSGGQYRDGTTDITRTVAVGVPPSGAVRDFTLVLKGHIALAMARFPKGARGVDLDVLARIALWRNGRDYAHGTGHGVGSYLNVHEGPQNISKRGMEPLKAGMIVSNEPGYYVEGEYGIRIENLVLVTQDEELDGNVTTHSFETLTLAPIDKCLIDSSLLTACERDWLNAYHARVKNELSPHLEPEVVKWLEAATTPI